MKCSEFHEQAAAYALDALDDDEARACAVHLAEEGPHEECVWLVARYAGVVARLAESLADEPVAPSVWHAIAARIGASAPRRLLQRTTTVIALAAAAAALLVALSTRHDAQVARRRLAETNSQLTSSGGALARAESERLACAALLQRATDSSALARDAVSLLEDGATRLTPMTPSGARQVRAVALYNPVKKRALAVSSTVQPIDGKDYELWVIAAGAPPKPAGFLRFDGRGVALGEFDAALLAQGRPSALAISLEQAGGAPAPTEVLMIAKL
ncbi:MAG: anti-sigma factor [Polyangiales bacterium]